MKRKDFLKGTGLAGLGFALTGSKLNTKSIKKPIVNNSACALIPSETAGPFPLDLTTNSFFLRQDIREDKTGAQLNLKMKIIGQSNCEPMPNVRVNIWHCDKDGNYSGYGTESGLTYCRGYQMTDANGEAEFVTVFPGWYPGRVWHIHFQVYVSEMYAAISQLTADHDAVNEVYAAFPSLYPKGADPKTPATDGIFNDGNYNLQTATLTPNAETGGYDAYLEVTVVGEGTVGISRLEKEAEKIFELQQNTPNPYLNKTTIPFSLKVPSKVKVDLWDLSGKKIATLLDEQKSVGEYEVTVNPTELGIPNGNYLYQLEAINERGTFRLPKMMTYQK